MRTPKRQLPGSWNTRLWLGDIPCQSPKHSSLGLHFINLMILCSHCTILHGHSYRCHLERTWEVFYQTGRGMCWKTMLPVHFLQFDLVRSGTFPKYDKRIGVQAGPCWSRWIMLSNPWFQPPCRSVELFMKCARRYDYESNIYTVWIPSKVGNRSVC